MCALPAPFCVRQMAKGKAKAKAKAAMKVTKESTSSHKVMKVMKARTAVKQKSKDQAEPVVSKGKRALVAMAEGEPMGKNAAQETMNELKRRAKAGDDSMLKHYKGLGTAEKRVFALKLSVDKTAITLTRCREDQHY